MKQGLTLFEAQTAWKNHQDVICPYCEGHVHEEESQEYYGEIWHYDCVQADIRCEAADEWEYDYDPQI